MAYCSLLTLTIQRIFITAAEQAEIQKKIDALQAEVEKQDNDIHHLQKYLKEAEHLLATAVYQARQKLQCIAKSNEKSVHVDELIKYAHRISCSYAVAAPHNWQPGDPRRPYPTDIEMRLGFLGRLSDLPSSGGMLQQQQGSLDMGVARGAHGELFESMIAPKGQKLTSGELAQLAELLVSKDQDLKSTLAIGNFIHS
ncbi:UNVERIFIED_CONTAM: med4 [Trichonephila clavipes]